MSGEHLAKAVGNGKFVVTAECRPPRGADVARIKACAAALGSSVDAVYIPESDDGVRLSSLAASGHLATAGAEPIMALLTRDLNRIALQSALLGAASGGIKNVLCTTGRHQALTTSGSARGVFDIDPIQLLRVADGMRKEGRLADGQSLDAPIDLVLGIDANPFAEPVELQVLALEKAINAGADFVITQPVFNLDRFNIWMSYVRERGLHENACIIASVMPLSSAQEAVALAEKFNILDIGDDVVERLQSAQYQRAAGMHLAKETIDCLRKIEGVRGVHLMTGEDFELAAEVIKDSGLSRS
ncbi:MAG: methylenetetrahydrofolate reductase [Armatimonadetes bacterium]|nr:methylenetetrahydrofolate reductase [Armatimonadota bacterium]